MDRNVLSLLDFSLTIEKITICLAIESFAPFGLILLKSSDYTQNADKVPSPGVHATRRLFAGRFIAS
jgi:hypothetical protein